MIGDSIAESAARLSTMCQAMEDRLFERSMVAFVSRYTSLTPDKLCIADPEESLSYAEMWERILGKATTLSRMGLRRNGRVLARVWQRGDSLALLFATHLLGAVFIPAPWDLPEVAFRVMEARLSPTLSLWNAIPIEAPTDKPQPHMPVADDPATILYTTGTTGASKGIVLTHRAEVAAAQNVFYGTQMEAGTVELIPMPISHSYGLRHCFGLLLGGQSAVLADGVAFTEDFFYLMDRYGVNALSLTPAAFSLLQRFAPGQLGARANTIRYVQMGTAGTDAAMRDEVRGVFPKSRLYQYYSSTEAGCACIHEFRTEAGYRRVGKPAVNAVFQIVDESGHPMQSGPGRWGRIACLGPMNMSRYDGDPQLTAETLRDGWVLSSDLGFIDGEGYLCFVTRAGDVINTGGFKVAPQEVEEAAMASGLLIECACCGEEDALLGQVPVLYAVPKPDSDATAVLFWLSKRLARWQMPHRIIPLSAVPRNRLGKIQRDRCRAAAVKEVET